MYLTGNLWHRFLSLGLLMLALVASGCGGDNSSFGKRQEPADVSGEQDAGDDTSPSNNPTADSGPGGDTADATETDSDTEADGDCSDTDEPDLSFEDANCDGVDGDRAKSVFVASYGDDANDGSMGSPKRSIQAAIDTAHADSQKSWVLVESAMFEESLELRDGVHVVGGYGFGWKRSEGGPTLIRGGNPVIRGVDIASTTRLVDLEVEQNHEPSDGETVVAVYLENSPAVELWGVKITGGPAGGGTDGEQGAAGERGIDGASGGNGTERGGVGSWDPTCNWDDEPSPGDGSTSSCGGRAGGQGGRPGHSDGAGLSGSGGAGGASGGGGGASKHDGEDGSDGADGSTGTAGSGGQTGGHFDGMAWVGQAGTEGGVGAGGAGGGGGGGGGGGTSYCDSYGGAGGGGGSGGCGGSGGEGGRAGGASVALFLLESAGVTIVDCQIYAGVGGDGGAGGAGGPGGQGGAGGVGGNAEDDSGRGGGGGKGGDGGPGGAGGGGAGGPSFAIYSNAELVSEPVDSTIEEGAGGQGGSSGSASGRGEDGAAYTIFVAE